MQVWGVSVTGGVFLYKVSLLTHVTDDAGWEKRVLGRLWG